MLKSILGVIAGYILMAVVVVAVNAVGFIALGDSGTYQAGSLAVTGTYVGIMIGGGTAAAILGGALCKLISRRSGAVLALAVVVGLLGSGLALATPTVRQAAIDAIEDDAVRAEVEAGRRPEGLTMMEAANLSQPPAWYPWANVGVGVVGVFVGGLLVRGKPAKD